jgi:hypothetical protein
MNTISSSISIPGELTNDVLQIEISKDTVTSKETFCVLEKGKRIVFWKDSFPDVKEDTISSDYDSLGRSMCEPMKKTKLYSTLDYVYVWKPVKNISRPLLVKENITLLASGMQSIVPTATKALASYTSDPQKMKDIKILDENCKTQDRMILELKKW